MAKPVFVRHAERYRERRQPDVGHANPAQVEPTSGIAGGHSAEVGLEDEQ
jgi:hypothetical protein